MIQIKALGLSHPTSIDHIHGRQKEMAQFIPKDVHFDSAFVQMNILNLLFIKSRALCIKYFKAIVEGGYMTWTINFKSK